METKEKRRQLELIRRAFGSLEFLNNRSMTHWRDRLFAKCREEEKGHRHFCPEGVKCGLSLADAARLFVVKDVSDYLLGEKPTEPKMWNHMRESALMACGLVAEYGDEIQAAWMAAKVNAIQVAALDYVELIKP